MDINEHQVVTNLKRIYEREYEARNPRAAAVFLLID